MKITRRILSLVLALALAVLCMPIIGASAGSANIDVDGATLTLNNNIGIHFFVQASKLSAYDSSYMRVEFPNRTGGGTTEWILEPTDATIDGTPCKVYYFGGIAPDQMGSDVTAQLFAVKGATTYTAGSFTYAVTGYIYHMKGKYRALDNLMADVLAYGRAAEAYTGKTSIPDTAAITALLDKATSDDVATTAASSVKKLTYSQGVTNVTASMKFNTAGVNLRDSAALVYTFSAAEGKSAADYSLKIEVEGHNDKLVPLTAGQTVYRFRGLDATETGKAVRATFVDSNGDPVSATLTYSVESYAYYCYKNRASDETLNTLTQTLIRYGRAIETYGNAPFELPFHKGININCMEGKAYTTSSYNVNNYDSTYYLSRDDTYSRIKDKGFDYVRVPVCLSKYYNTSTDTLYTSGNSGFIISNVDTVIDKAINAGLYVILDFHDWDFNGTGAVFSANDANQRALFVKIWEKVADHYKNYSDKLVFELINEPAKDTSSAYYLNLVQNAAIAKIRETNPTRIILATVSDASQPWYLYNSTNTSDPLANSIKLTEGTTRVGVVVHCYNPGAFTHQGVKWALEFHDATPLTDSHRGTLRWDLAQVKKFIDNNPDIPVIIDEFGVVHKSGYANTDDITEYLTMVREWCESNYVPWAYWQYIGDEMGARVTYNGSWYDYVLAGLGLN